MFCHKCGNQMEDDSIFCPKCGAKQSADDTVKGVHAQETIAAIQPQTQSQNIKSKKSKKLPILLVIAALVIVAVVFIVINWEGKIDYEATVRAYTPYANSQGLPYTCGEVIDKYIPDAKWETRQSGDIAYVDIGGTAKGTDKELAITIQVKVEDDRAFMDPVAIKVDGREASTKEETETVFFALFVAYDEKHDDLSIFDEGGIDLTEVFTDEITGISFRYPAGWKVLDTPSEFQIVEMIDSRNTADHIARLTVNRTFERDPYGVFTQDRATVRETVSEYYTYIDFGDILIGDVPAKGITYRTAGLKGDDIVTSIWYVMGDEVYQITYSCSASTAEDYEPIFNAMMESYRITRTDAGSQPVGSTVNPAGSYAPIIDAYATLEQSGYTIIDESLIGDSLLTVQQSGTYNFGWDELPELGYAIYDLNGNGSPELLIGVKSFGEYTISGIYTMDSGSPASIIQVEDQQFLSVTADIDGNCVIGYSWGHMGAATEAFYTLVPDAQTEYLGLLCELVTEPGDPAPIRYVGDYTGESGYVRITEDEYISLIQQYGASGYETFAETRNVSFNWTPVLAN